MSVRAGSPRDYEALAYRCVVVVFVLAGLAAIAFALLTAGHERYADEEQYWSIARSVATGEGYRLAGLPTAYRPPTWPLLLAVPALFGPDLRLAVLINPLLLIATGVVAARLGVRLAGHRLGIVAGLAVLGYPVAIYTAGTLYPQTLATLLIVSLWLLLARGADRGLGILASLGFGAMLAALALAVPTLALTAAVLGLAGVALQRHGRLRFALLAGLAAVLPVLAWAVRNKILVGAFVPLSTTSGVNLLQGNNAHATATTGANSDISAQEAYVNAHPMTELERNDYYGGEAVSWITQHPGRAVVLYLEKIANYFTAYNQPATTENSSTMIAVVSWLCFVVVVGLVALRLSQHLRGSRRLQAHEKLMLWLFVANAPVMAVFFTRVRFRLPLDSILLVEAALALVWLLRTQVFDRPNGSRSVQPGDKAALTMPKDS